MIPYLKFEESSRNNNFMSFKSPTTVTLTINKRNILIGIVFIVIGLWFYFALSSFEIEDNRNTKKIVVKEGVVRAGNELARELAMEIGYDLDEAYKTGFNPRDVIEYLRKDAHNFSITLHEGRYYEGRVMIPYKYPFAVCVIIIFIGAGLIVFTGFRKKS